ncbi:MAG: aspartate/glutamate racemase family protein [Geminicoccaceae bacterium]
MRLLVINPNTSDFVTDTVAKEARRAASTDTEIIAVTGKKGPSIIGGRAENALGAVSSLELAAEHATGVDAVLLAVSFDSGLKPLRELLSVPVVGMSEAAMLTACMVGGRFSMVTFGERAVALYQELADDYGLAQRCAGVRSLPPLSESELRDPSLILPGLIDQIGCAVADQGAESVILSGAVFAGMAAQLSNQVSVPVIDGIAAGVCMAESLHRLGLRKPASGSYQLPSRKDLKGTTTALTKLYARLPP